MEERGYNYGTISCFFQTPSYFLECKTMAERYPTLKQSDPEIYNLIQKQTRYEATTLKMIASESYASLGVMEACGSPLTNKYCEGYPGARYYEGNEFVDQIENLAIERGKQLFGAEHVNVQPYSGSPANQAVYRSILNIGDKIMGIPVTDGGQIGRASCRERV